MKNKLLNLLILSLIAILLVSCSNAKLSKEQKKYLSQNKNTSIGIYVNYPPYQFVNNNGKIEGILLDYFSKLESNIGFTFKRKYYHDWQLLIEDAKNEKIDLILEIQSTEEKKEFLTFTKPIFIGKHIILTKDNNNYTSMKDLDGKKIAVGKNFSIEDYLKKNYPNIVIKPMANEEKCISALINDNVDAFIGIEAITNYIIRKEGYKNLKIQETLDYDYELSIGINKNEEVLAEIINQANNAITIEDKNQILNKWLYEIAKPFDEKVPFWKKLFAALGILFVLSFLVSLYLKKEVKRRTKQLNKAKLVAEKNNELKTLFLQNISHEVRTPLNSIVGFASFLKENELNNNNKTDYLDTIVQQSSNLTNILNNIIEISELTTSKTKAKLQPFCLAKELKIIAEIYEAKATCKKLGFNFNNSISRPKSIIISDKSRVSSAISNLLDNAIKFTVNGSITLDAKIQKNKIIIKIINTGIGIDPQKSKAIFHEFYQVEKELSKKYDGLGIGLTIANENIKSINGTIRLDDDSTKTTSFTITIPYKPISNKIGIKTPLTISSTLRILIAEDMKLNYLVLQKILDKIIINDKKITWAKNGKEALEYIEKETFDIIFMDIKMPILDGYQVTKQIKILHPEIPIIAQTAYAHEEDYNKAIKIGFDGYLTKPINSNALKVILQDLFVIKITSD